MAVKAAWINVPPPPSRCFIPHKPLDGSGQLRFLRQVSTFAIYFLFYYSKQLSLDEIIVWWNWWLKVLIDSSYSSLSVNEFFQRPPLPPSSVNSWLHSSTLMSIHVIIFMLQKIILILFFYNPVYSSPYLAQKQYLHFRNFLFFFNVCAVCLKLTRLNNYRGFLGMFYCLFWI